MVEETPAEVEAEAAPEVVEETPAEVEAEAAPEVVEETPAEVEAEATPEVVEEKADGPLEEFDWDVYEEGGITSYSKEEFKNFETMYDATIPDENQVGVIDGTIVNLTDREAIIDIKGKSEGVVSLNEFRYNPNLKVGDTVEVLVDQKKIRQASLYCLIEKHVLFDLGIE